MGGTVDGVRFVCEAEVSSAILGSNQHREKIRRDQPGPEIRKNEAYDSLNSSLGKKNRRQYTKAKSLGKPCL